MTDPSRKRGVAPGVPQPVENESDRPTGWGLKDIVVAVGVGAAVGAGIGAYSGFEGTVGTLSGAESGAILGAGAGGLYGAYRYYVKYDRETNKDDPSVTPEERGVIEVLGNNPFGWWAAGIARTGKDWYNSFTTSWGFKKTNIDSWKEGATPEWTHRIETGYRWTDLELVEVISQFYTGDRGELHRYVGLGDGGNFEYFNWWILFKYGWRAVRYPDMWKGLFEKSPAELWATWMGVQHQDRNEDSGYSGQKLFADGNLLSVNNFLKWALHYQDRAAQVYLNRYGWKLDDAIVEYRREHALVDTEESWNGFYLWSNFQKDHRQPDLSELGKIDPALEKFFVDNYHITVEQAYINYRKSYPRPGPEYQSVGGARGWLAWARDTYSR